MSSLFQWASDYRRQICLIARRGLLLPKRLFFRMNGPICIFLVFKNKNNSHSAWLFHWKIASPLQSKLPAALYYIRYPLNRIGLVEKARVNAAPTFIPQMPTYLGYAAQIERLPGTTACRVQHPNISPKLFFFFLVYLL